MKTLISIFMLLFAQTLLSQKESVNPKVYDDLKPEGIEMGEELNYKATFGWFNVGTSKITVSDKLYIKNGRECLKVDVYGKTAGWVDFLSKVDDHWGAYLDRKAIVPQYSYRYLKEGNYRKNEVVDYDHVNDSLFVKTFNRKISKWGNSVAYKSKNNVRDMVAGFFLLRTMDFSQMKKGDFFEVHGFHEDTFYDLKIIFLGREYVKTKLGTIHSIILLPVMPENSIFDGENSIRVWISDDKNQIPVKFEAKMFLGDAGIEIVGTKNLMYPLNIRKK